ncbi:MAG: hypothetical protein DYG93_02275 [Leptolyngbya sp. PLA2]|nr:hypothetical protein [Leptolyngbya sp. PL-A2]MCQ3940525.1 hypothetical protein [cyanobacterium CYA1]MCZ7633992.1 hypothetical protein [Phycisphaerales bacterium]MDL1904377.1 hypothetical protein [Synechococcales cyanobacterium CNB]GIK19610.1 MAG: acetolactate synthase [Planctomycetota bacterium]
MQISRLTEFSIYLADRPGELAGVLEALRAAGVQAEAVAVSEHNGRGLVRLIGTPEEALRRVCEGLCDSGAGPVAETQVLCVGLDERPGAFAEVAARLGVSRINIRYAYQSPSANGTPARCIFRVDDLAAAEGVLRSLA